MALGVSVVIPAYNEEQRLPATLTALARQLDEIAGEWEVLVVDDGSSDDTRSVALGHSSDQRVRVLGGPPNRGKGAALGTGFAAARLPYVFFMDADSPVPLDTIARFRDLAAGADIVTGTRRAAGATIRKPQPAGRRLAGRAYLAVLWCLGLRSGSDPQCGVKLLRRDRVAEVVAATRAAGFAFDVELLVRARSAGLTVVESPVDWRHVDGSSIRPWHDAWRTAVELAALRRSLRRDRVVNDPPGAP